MNNILLIGSMPPADSIILKGHHRVTINLKKHLSDDFDLITLKKNCSIWTKLFGLSVVNRNEFAITFYEISVLLLFFRLFKYKKVLITAGFYHSIVAILVKWMRFNRLKVIHRSGGIVFMERTIAKGEPGRHSLVNQRLEYFVWRFADTIIIPSSMASEQVISKYPRLKERVHLLPNGIDEGFLKYPKLPDKMKKNSVPHILTVASLYKIKGLDLLLNAIAEVEEPLCLTIVGDGLPSYKKELENIIQSNKTFNNKTVQFLKSVSTQELAELYKNSDLYIQPSRFDVFPNAVVESYYFGTPIIISNRVGTHDFIANWKNCSVSDASTNVLSRMIRYRLGNLIFSRDDIVKNEVFWKFVVQKYVY